MNYPQLALRGVAPDVTIHTSRGDIGLKLFKEQAPKTVQNFIELAKKGYYDDVIFHRIIDNFMIQGGDPTGTGMGGESIYGAKFEDEFSSELYHFKGALSMANAGPNTNGSQFFIVTANKVPMSMLGQMASVGYEQEVMDYYAKKGGTPWLDHRHTVFGQVVSGFDVVRRLGKAKTDAQDRPKRRIYIQNITIH